MENNMTHKILNGLLLVALASASGVASAQISSAATVSFNKPSQAPGATPSDFTGKANIASASTTNTTCGGVTGTAGCFIQNGIAVGAVSDPTDAGSHFHIESDSLNGVTAAGMHSDANGLYIRTLDSTAFSLTSLTLNFTIQQGNSSSLGDNPVYGTGAYVDDTSTLQPTGSTYTQTDANGNPLGILPQGQTDPNYNGYYNYPTSVVPASTEGWEILGFSNAVNPNLASGNGVNYSDLVASQFVAQGFDGKLTLNSSFANVSGVWIYYNGYPEAPTNGIVYLGLIDSFTVGAAVSAVPVPAAAWLFAGGLASLLSFGRKKSGQVV